MTTSTATLTSLRERLETALMDSSNLTWQTPVLDEAIRRALARISLVYGGDPLLLCGLDSALLTTLLQEDEGALLCGAEFYAAVSRMIDRLETPNLNDQVPERFQAWTDRTAGRFNSLLEQIRKRLLQQSPNAPHAALEWDEGTPVW